MISKERLREMRLENAARHRARRRNDPPWGKPMSAEQYVAAHEAWAERLVVRFGGISARNDREYYENQCGGCRFYMPIEGASAADWGACGNPASDRIGSVVFEHHGCPQHSEGPGFSYEGDDA